jgi:hypothetical protein
LRIKKCRKQGLYLKAVWSFWRSSAEREGSSPPTPTSSPATALSASCTDDKGYPVTLCPGKFCQCFKVRNVDFKNGIISPFWFINNVMTMYSRKFFLDEESLLFSFL